MGFRIKNKRPKHKRRRAGGGLGADLADFILFAANFLTPTNEATYHAILGHFTFRWRDGMLYCGYTFNGTTTLVGTQGPPTVEKISALIGDSYFRVHPRGNGIGAE